MTLQKSFVSKWLFIWHWDQKIAAKPAKFIWGNNIHWNSTQRSIRNGSLPNVLLFEKENKKNQSVGEISEVFRFSWFRVLIMISYRNCERRYYNGTCDLWGKSYKSGNEEEFGVDVFYNCLSRRNHFAMRWLVGAPPVGDIRCHKKVNWISDTSKVKSRYLVWYNNFDLTCDFWIINEVSSLKWIVKRI